MEDIEADVDIREQSTDSDEDSENQIGRRNFALKRRRTNSLSPRRPRPSVITDSEDDQTCTICFEEFETSGMHRTACLKCGHVFGESCIRRWLTGPSEQKFCPQCKTKANTRDIRLIYLKNARVVDNSKEIELQNELQQLKDERNFFLINDSSQKAEIKRLSDQVERLKRDAIISTTCAKAGIRSIKECKIYLEKNMDFKEDLHSRLMKYLPAYKKIMVSQKAPALAMFPGFGIKIIDFQTYRQEKFINTSSLKDISDFNIDPTQSFLVTASKEPFCKVFNIKSNENVCTFRHTSPVPFWACTFDNLRHENLFLGGQNGSVFKFDSRNANEVVSVFTCPQMSSSPVKFIVPMKGNQSFPQGGYFVVYMRGLNFFDDVNHATTTLSHDSISTLTYDEKTEMLLITKSPVLTGNNFIPTRHYLMKLLRDTNDLSRIPYLQEIFSYNGTISRIPKFTRPAQIKVADGVLLASYLEDTRTLQIRSHSENRVFHEASIGQDIISDVCPFESNMFGALSNSKLRLYKINLSY